jgi:hypothetical protein
MVQLKLSKPLFKKASWSTFYASVQKVADLKGQSLNRLFDPLTDWNMAISSAQEETPSSINFEASPDTEL